MSKDRIIIIACLLLMVGLLCGAASLMPQINYMRQDLQLTAHDDVIENMPPEIALTQAALGSFRGLAVDVLWGRVRRMQSEGKLYEAMQLAEWITKLQPRFAQVWVFHAWNMAYNISVTTATPQERWMWVKAGVRLLRDEAIPLNPNNVQLHRELGWIFLHKIGMYSDDMHLHYKAELAAEWHELLGEPPQDGTTEDHVEWFEPIALMYEAYVNERELGFAVRDELDRLRGVEAVAEDVPTLAALTIHQLDTRLRRLMGNADKAEHLSGLRAAVTAQMQEARRDPVARLRAGDEAVAAELVRLRERGFRPDFALVQKVAELEMRRTSGDIRLLDRDLPELSEEDAWLMDWLVEEETAEARERLLAFARARVLRDTHRMDPVWMYELMRGEWLVEGDEEPLALPIDWRHPAAHGIYWSSLGVRRNSGLLRPNDFMVLNTDRQVVQSLQYLTRTGNLVFDPATRYYRMMPDPRYIDGYHAAVFGASDRIGGEYAESAAPESFKSGHENFLTAAVQQAYFYGEPGQARRYYGMLRELYSDFRPDRLERYSQPLDDFVFNYMIEEEVYQMDHALAIVTGLVMQAIDEGLANGRREVSDRFMDQARRTHRYYNSQRAQIARSEAGDRLSLPAFQEMVGDTFARFMMTPLGQSPNPLMKARAWQNAPTSLKRQVWDRVSERLVAQAEYLDLNPETMFPEPEGMTQYRRARGIEEPESDPSVLRSQPERQ